MVMIVKNQLFGCRLCDSFIVNIQMFLLLIGLFAFDRIETYAHQQFDSHHCNHQHPKAHEVCGFYFLNFRRKKHLCIFFIILIFFDYFLLLYLVEVACF